MTKQGSKQSRAVKQRENSAKKPKGKPFEKGNPHAFKPGQSGNPAGRPKTRTLSEAYRRWLGSPMANDPTRTNANGVAEMIGKRALSGDVVAAKEICDRVEGRPKQTVDVTLEDRKREMVENAIVALITETQISREEAIEQLIAVAPEMNAWIN